MWIKKIWVIYIEETSFEMFIYRSLVSSFLSCIPIFNGTFAATLPVFLFNINILEEKIWFIFCNIYDSIEFFLFTVLAWFFHRWRETMSLFVAKVPCKGSILPFYIYAFCLFILVSAFWLTNYIASARKKLFFHWKRKDAIDTVKYS